MADIKITKHADNKIQPKTRLEKFLAKIAKREDVENLEPKTRLEYFLNKIATEEDSGETLEPETRLEYFLNEIAENKESSSSSYLQLKSIRILNSTGTRIRTQKIYDQEQGFVGFTWNNFIINGYSQNTYSLVSTDGAEFYFGVEFEDAEKANSCTATATNADVNNYKDGTAKIVVHVLQTVDGNMQITLRAG